MVAPRSTGPQVLRSALALFTANPDWLPPLSDAITRAIHAELPELNSDPDLRASTYASTESVLRLLAEMIATDRAPEEVLATALSEAGPRGEEILQQAVHDPEPPVRNMARYLLERGSAVPVLP